MKRLAKLFNVKEEEAAGKLEQIDKEQAEFYRSVYGLKDAVSYEFDMVINCDFIREPEWATGIIAQAFKEKFGVEVTAT
ncbi:MAG: cytidylate kinase family protein [Pseudomonadota bacterium]